LLDGLDDLDFEENFIEEKNNFFEDKILYAEQHDFLEQCRQGSLKKTNNTGNASLDFNRNNFNDNKHFNKINQSSNIKNKLIIDKKKQIQQNIEKEKIKNAKIFHFNFEQQKPNSELSNTINVNYSNIKNVSATPKNNNEKLIFSNNKQKQNRNILKSLYSSEIAGCFRKDFNKPNKEAKVGLNGNNDLNHLVLLEEANFDFDPEHYNRSEIKIITSRIDNKNINSYFQSSNINTNRDSD